MGQIHLPAVCVMPLDLPGARGILDEIVNVPGREDPVEQRINDGAGDKAVQVVEEIELRHAGGQRHGQVDGRDKAGQGWSNPHGPLLETELAACYLYLHTTKGVEETGLTAMGARKLMPWLYQ